MRVVVEDDLPEYELDYLVDVVKSAVSAFDNKTYIQFILYQSYGAISREKKGIH